MQCEICGVKEAHINITKVMNGISEVHHYCQDCFKKLNEENAVSMSKSFLKMMLDSITAGRLRQEEQASCPDIACPKCRKNFRQFIQDKSFSCDKCYDTFEASFRDMLCGLPEASASSEASDSISLLEAKLHAAVENENYREAAVLRDRIAALRKDKK